jgi:hypothetical protein
MTYKQYVYDTFTEDQLAAGLDMDEINDILVTYSFEEIEKWLDRKGYMLKEEYNLQLN